MSDWPLVALNDDGIRPAGRPDECFYCRQRVGQPHARDCVIVTKRVRLRYTIEVDVDVPYDATPRSIEFYRNDSTWCADNALDDIRRHTREEGPDCLCARFRATFVRVVDDTPQRKLREPEPRRNDEVSH